MIVNRRFACLILFYRKVSPFSTQQREMDINSHAKLHLEFHSKYQEHEQDTNGYSPQRCTASITTGWPSFLSCVSNIMSSKSTGFAAIRSTFFYHGFSWSTSTATGAWKCYSKHLCLSLAIFCIQVQFFVTEDRKLK